MKGTNRTEDLTTEHFLNGLKSTPTMGCSPSRKPSEHRTTLEPDLFLTEREIQLVKCSWDLIQEVMLETGMEIYANFLKTLESDVLKLFSKIITTEDNGNTLGVDHEMLQRHAMLVMQGIGTAVELLEDVDELNTFLKVLGEKHCKLRVKPYMLERLWPAIDYSFRGVLSDVYEKELRNAWKTFFDYMVYKMREYMFNARKRQSEDKNDTMSMFTPRTDRNGVASTPRGQSNGTPRVQTNGTQRGQANGHIPDLRS